MTGASDLLEEHFHLFQCIHEPTHKDRNVLDLILTKNPELVHSYKSIPTVNSISHHHHTNPFTLQYSNENKLHTDRKPNNCFELYNYFSADTNWKYSK